MSGNFSVQTGPHVANLLDSNEMIDKLLDSDDSEFLDTDESSDTDFSEQEDNAFLLDISDNSGVGDTAYMSGNNFLCMWTIMSDYKKLLVE
jgi:hypothetical protein